MKASVFKIRVDVFQGTKSSATISFKVMKMLPTRNLFMGILVFFLVDEAVYTDQETVPFLLSLFL